MEARDVETSIAAGEQALQALLQCARASAGTREAHAAEPGLCKRRLPMGLAALKRSLAQGGTGDVGPAVTRADGVFLPREQPLRGRESCSRFGTFAVARTGDRTPGAPGICPLDAQVNRPARGDAYVLQEWMPWFAVEHPFQERASWCEPCFALELAESVLMEVAQEAPAASAGALLVVSVDGTGGPMMTAEAVKRKATLGPGEKRPRKKAALVGVGDTVDAKPRSPEALAERLVDPEAAHARQQRAGTADAGPRAHQVRRVASLVRTKPAVRELIKADAERRDPQHHHPVVVWRDGALGLWHLAPKLFTPWKRVTSVRDIIHVVSDLGTAATAWFPEGSRGGKPWVQATLTAMLSGRVGSVIGGLRQLLTKRRLRQSVRETLANVVVF